MFDKLEAVENRFVEIESRLADPDLADRPGDFRRLSQEHAGLLELVSEYRRYQAAPRGARIQQGAAPRERCRDRRHGQGRAQAARARARGHDPQAPDPAPAQGSQRRQERRSSKSAPARAATRPRFSWVSSSASISGMPSARAGAWTCFRSIRPGWAASRKSSPRSRDSGVFSRLKWEGGVHRVQRVPATEAQGRIHTSTVTVAVLPGGRGGRRPDQPGGSAHRRVPLGRRWRPGRQHDRLRRAHHAHCPRGSSWSARTSARSSRTKTRR